jgi:hypothetical protein
MPKPVQGTDDGTTDYGVEGTSASATGVLGVSESSIGVLGQVGTPREVLTELGSTAAPVTLDPSAGVVGHGYDIGEISGTPATHGVYGRSLSGGDGVYGNGTNGVHGVGAPGGYGVLAENQNATAIRGVSSTADPAKGSAAESHRAGVWGDSDDGIGVYGTSAANNGVQGETWWPNQAGIAASNHAAWDGRSVPSCMALSAESAGTAVYGKGSPAAYFVGDMQITGDVILLNSSGDVAEDFDIDDGADLVEPGTVLVIGASGALCPCVAAYDTRVAGVVSGAGGLMPAVVLQRLESGRRRVPVALVGTAFCKADASAGEIRPGDLLTTSSRLGHAMKVLDHTRAAGAILGKALQSLHRDHGLIQILVSPR